MIYVGTDTCREKRYAVGMRGNIGAVVTYVYVPAMARDFSENM